MGNEITWHTAFKVFAVIAASPLLLDPSCVLENVISKLTTFLQMANQALRQTTLGTLIVAYGDKIGSAAYEVIILEHSTLISDSDLHMTALALELCCMLMYDRRSNSDCGLSVRSKALLQVQALVKSSSSIQGQALTALQSFFATLVYSANKSFDTLLESLISKQAFLLSIAQCVALLCLTAEMFFYSKVALKDDHSTTNSAKQHLAFLCLGETGRRKDLSSHAHIENIIIKSFQSPVEEIKSAGNLPKYLPFILDQIDNQQKKQYLLLHSLKEEVIVRQSVDKAADFQDSSVEKILSLLFNHCRSEEEGVRNLVAECLGMIKPAKLVPALKERTTNPAAFTRATAVVAAKQSIFERSEKIDEIIYPEISSFLMLIKDHYRRVGRAAVLALSIAARNKPILMKDLLPELFLLLYDQTIIKQELIRTVDRGPSKHIVVDDGLELRKAAFECVDTLLDSCLDQVNPSSFIVPYLTSGLDDPCDVEMPWQSYPLKTCGECPPSVLAVLDSLVDPLQKTVNFRPKQDAVKQEVDRNEDMIQSALRAITGGDCNHKFKSLMPEIAKSQTQSLALQA